MIKNNLAELNELIALTAEQLQITEPSIIEKDYYLTFAIHAFSSITHPYFHLVFKGGTCLAKAH